MSRFVIDSQLGDKASPVRPRSEILILISLAAVQFSNIMDFMILMPLGPQLMRYFSLSPEGFANLVSAYTFAAAASGLIAALFLDRFGRKRTLLVLYTGFILSTIGVGLAQDFQTLLVARTLSGVFGGILGSVVLAIVGDIIPPERRAAAVGIVMTAFSAAAVFGVPFGFELARTYDWHAPFVFLAAFCTVNLLVLIPVLPAVSGHVARSREHGVIANLRELFSDRRPLLGLVLMSLMVYTIFSVIPFLTPYLVANTGYPESKISLVYFLGGAATIFTSPLIGRWADRAGKHKVFMIMGTLAVIPVLVLTHLPVVPMAVVLVTTTFLMIMVNGRMVPGMAILTSTVPPTHRGSYMSFVTVAQQFSSGLAARISGSILTTSASGLILNYDLTGYIAATAGIAAVLFVRFVQPIQSEIIKRDS